MKKVITLTESQLKQVVEKIIEEQSITQKVGRIGKSISKVAHNLDNEYEKLKQKAKTMVLKSALPLHLRSFMDFISLRKIPMSNNDFTKQEIEALRQMLVFAEKKGILKKNGGNIDFSNVSNLLNKGGEQIDFSDRKNLGFNQASISSDFVKIAMTLGNAFVKKSGTKYIINDLYDFNNFINHPEKYTLLKVPQTVLDSLMKIGTGNYVQGVEQLASYYQKLGYPGYPVHLEVA